MLCAPNLTLEWVDNSHFPPVAHLYNAHIWRVPGWGGKPTGIVAVHIYNMMLCMVVVDLLFPLLLNQRSVLNGGFCWLLLPYDFHPIPCYSVVHVNFLKQNKICGRSLQQLRRDENWIYNWFEYKCFLIKQI